MDEPEVDGFVQAWHCAGCDDPLGPEGNWACVHEFVPVAGAPGVFIEVHVHSHAKCAPTTYVKWKILRELGHAFRMEN